MKPGGENTSIKAVQNKICGAETGECAEIIQSKATETCGTNEECIDKFVPQFAEAIWDKIVNKPGNAGLTDERKRKGFVDSAKDEAYATRFGRGDAHKAAKALKEEYKDSRDDVAFSPAHYKLSAGLLLHFNSMTITDGTEAGKATMGDRGFSGYGTRLLGGPGFRVDALFFAKWLHELLKIPTDKVQLYVGPALRYDTREYKPIKEGDDPIDIGDGTGKQPITSEIADFMAKQSPGVFHDLSALAMLQADIPVARVGKGHLVIGPQVGVGATWRWNVASQSPASGGPEESSAVSDDKTRFDDWALVAELGLSASVVIPHEGSKLQASSFMLSLNGILPLNPTTDKVVQGIPVDERWAFGSIMFGYQGRIK